MHIVVILMIHFAQFVDDNIIKCSLLRTEIIKFNVTAKGIYFWTLAEVETLVTDEPLC